MAVSRRSSRRSTTPAVKIAVRARAASIASAEKTLNQAGPLSTSGLGPTVTIALVTA